MWCWIIKTMSYFLKHKIISSYCSNYQLRPTVTLQCPVQMAIPIPFGTYRHLAKLQYPTIYFKRKCWSTAFFVYKVISRMNTISQQFEAIVNLKEHMFLQSPRICSCYLQSFDNYHSLKWSNNSKKVSHYIAVAPSRNERKKDWDSWNVIILYVLSRS